jgi:hypothetical protein
MVIQENMKSMRTALAKQLFSVGSEEQGDIKSDNKEDAAKGQRRVPVVKAALEKIMAAEKDPETLKEYNKLMKESFE